MKPLDLTIPKTDPALLERMVAEAVANALVPPKPKHDDTMDALRYSLSFGYKPLRPDEVIKISAF